MKKRLVSILLSALVVLALTACSSSKGDTMSENKASSPLTYGTSDTAYSTESKYADATDGSTLEFDSVKEGEGAASTESSINTESNGSSQNVSTNRKLIKKVYLELQTLEFTKTLDFILDKVKAEGGYVENSNVQGNAIYENDRRSAKLVIRIPSDMTDIFVNLIGENANVISKNEETKDITKEFVDTESRIKMLQIEQERLLSFLEKAETLKDMITLEDRLGEVRYELESYTSTLKTYQNLVEYSTITISIYEVKEIVAKAEKQSAFTRIGSGLNNSVTDIKEGFTNFFVWFVVNLPYFIIWGVLIAACIIIGLRANKKYKAKLREAANNTAVNTAVNTAKNISDDKKEVNK